VGTADGVLVSADAGASWARLGKDKPPGGVWEVTLVNRTLYASSDQGLWSMDLSGRAPCEQAVRVTPAAPILLGSGGGAMRFDIGAVPGCPWTATAGVDWAKTQTGPASVELSVQSNAGATRQATLNIAGMRVPLTQYGGRDPIADGATVAIASGAGCLISTGGGKLALSPCVAASAQTFRLHHERDLLYTVMAASSGLYWDMTQRRQAGIELYEHPNNGEDHQLFQFLPQADGTYSIFTTTGLQCLEARGDHLEQQACTGGDAQKFRVK
jgi:hypothetical protein